MTETKSLEVIQQFVKGGWKLFEDPDGESPIAKESSVVNLLGGWTTSIVVNLEMREGEIEEHLSIAASFTVPCIDFEEDGLMALLRLYMSGILRERFFGLVMNMEVEAEVGTRYTAFVEVPCFDTDDTDFIVTDSTQMLELLLSTFSVLIPAGQNLIAEGGASYWDFHATVGRDLDLLLEHEGMMC